MSTYEQDFEKALAAAELSGEEVPVYLDWPSAITTNRQREVFEALFKKWAKLVRSEGSGDLTGAADRIDREHPNVQFGPDETYFSEIISLMTHPASLRNAISKQVRDAQARARGTFVRFNVRSPKGAKIAFWG